MNRIKGIIYDWVLKLATLGKRTNTQTRKLLIVRVDEIGDYLLWHKFIREITGSDQYKDYECHLCGNRSWQALFQHFDAGYIREPTWLDKTKFKKDMFYRYRFLKAIYLESYETVINPTFSRDKRNDDSIVRAASADRIFGMVANQENVRSYEKGYDQKIYSALFPNTQSPLFEFYRNQLFTEWVTRSISIISNTRLVLTYLPQLTISIPENCFVVFPGSRSPGRIWPSDNFIRVSKYLYENYGWTAIVCGTKSDARYTQAFCTAYPHPFLDLTGKTSLLEMLSILSKSKCLLSVDTGSVHLAAAAGCPVFGIFNGSQYQRFAPYPENLAQGFHAIYPDEIEAELADSSIVRKKYERVVAVPYSLVRPEKVIHTIYKYFNRQTG